jgi:hypothetical protein
MQMHVFCLCLCLYSTFESELADAIPVVKTSISGTRIIGRLCAGTNNPFSFNSIIFIQYSWFYYFSSLYCIILLLEKDR